jgi:hypothetical protein
MIAWHHIAIIAGEHEIRPYIAMMAMIHTAKAIAIIAALMH